MVTQARISVLIIWNNPAWLGLDLPSKPGPVGLLVAKLMRTSHSLPWCPWCPWCHDPTRPFSFTRKKMDWGIVSLRTLFGALVESGPFQYCVILLWEEGWIFSSQIQIVLYSTGSVEISSTDSCCSRNFSESVGKYNLGQTSRVLLRISVKSSCILTVIDTFIKTLACTLFYFINFFLFI